MGRSASANSPTANAGAALRDTRRVPKELLQHIADNTPTQLNTPHSKLARVEGIAIGTLVAISDEGHALLDVADVDLAGVWAKSLVVLQAHHIGQQVAIAFEAGNPQRPMVMGVLVGNAKNPVPASRHSTPTEAIIDGERVVLTAAREIELRCGEAALILSADGHIQLRGTYITSQASATQRILGGSVNVN